MEDKQEIVFDAMYKCRLCGEVFANSRIDNIKQVERSLVEFRVFGNFTDPMCGKYVIHICDDNNMGIGDFCGYKVRKE